MQCPRCSAENPKQANFCLNCGDRLTLICSECGMELPPHARFCFSCGAQMAASQPAGEPRSAALSQALKRLVPREFAGRLLGIRGQVGKERRIVTILFSDVKRSTPMADSLDPEEHSEIMDAPSICSLSPLRATKARWPVSWGMASWPSSARPSPTTVTRSGPAASPSISSRDHSSTLDNASSAISSATKPTVDRWRKSSSSRSSA
jgi:ribosomal protein L40E